MCLVAEWMGQRMLRTQNQSGVTSCQAHEEHLKVKCLHDVLLQLKICF